MSVNKKSIEERLDNLERDWAWAKPIITELGKQYDLQKPRINPAKYCRNELDRKIIAYLIEHLGAGSTEIAKAIGLENPERLGRHLVGKRLKRIASKSSAEGWNILEFNPATRENPIDHKEKYRAWWLNVEDVDVAGFKKEMERIGKT
jgi:hypothetical protein